MMTEPLCRNPEDMNLGRMQADIEFLIERVSKLPTRREQAFKPLSIIAGSAGLVILFELFWRHCL
jgi:hypothetical protein